MNYLKKYLSASFLLITALFFAASSRPVLAQSVPPLGVAESFAALAGTTLTATGAGTVISGNVGVSPGLAVTGFPPAVVVNGQIYTGAGSLAGPAQASALIAYNNLKGQACPSANNLTGKILGETPGFLTLSPGVYCFDTSAQLNAILTLNDGGDPNAIFIFQIGTTLTTASSSQVVMSSGGRGKNVFWQIGTSATIGTSTTFRGHIIANTSITFTTSASTTGRVFALNGATTIDTVVLDAVPTSIQFSASSYAIGEGGGAVNVGVARTGDTSQAASVNYATSDPSGLNNCSFLTGNASARCDYIESVGTVRFAAGQTSKNISIPIVDDSYAEGNETFTITLSNAIGATLGSPNTATVTINDNEATNGANPIDGTPFFVRQQYLDFLNREPDPPGYAAWQAVLNNCLPGDMTCDRIHVSSSFFRSPEFQGRGYFVYRFYPVAFGRKPDYVEFTPDIAKVSGFLSDDELEAAKVAFIDEFMSRPAFITAYNGLNNTQYVDTLLSTAGITHSERDFWIAALGNGSRTRAQVLREISESPEVYNKYFNQAFVVMQYFGYLRRQPDGQYIPWIQHLDSTGDYRSMINGFMNSLEYRARFGP